MAAATEVEDTVAVAAAAMEVEDTAAEGDEAATAATGD